MFDFILKKSIKKNKNNTIKRRWKKYSVKKREKKPFIIKNRTKKGGVNIKKLNCSPIVENKTVNKNSCFTPEIIIQLKDAYNKRHENDKIVSKKPNDIWKELSYKMDHCNEEFCWLEKLDKETKEKVKNYFSPKHPKEWIENPNEWLSNEDILAVLRQYEQKYKEFKFLGPSMIDFDKVLENNNCVENELCHFSLEKMIENKKSKIGIIFNLDDHTKSGSHWVSLFIDIPEKVIFYFDSAGAKIPLEIKVFKDRVIEQGMKLQNKINFVYHDNEDNDHQQGNTECGMYSLFFIITMLTGNFINSMLTGNTDIKTNLSLEDKLLLFQKKKIDDESISQYRKIYFNAP